MNVKLNWDVALLRISWRYYKVETFSKVGNFFFFNQSGKFKFQGGIGRVSLVANFLK